MDFIPYRTQWIDDDNINEVVKVLKSDGITTGPNIKQFEVALCSYIECNQCVAVNGGTSVLDIVVPLVLPEGSEFITTPFTLVAISNAIHNCLNAGLGEDITINDLAALVCKDEG